MNRLPLYVLAGGKSSRFGSNKARFLLENKELLLHSIEPFLPWVSEITVVGKQKEEYLDLGFRTIPDLVPTQGPVMGLYSALLDAKSDWIVLTSCDLLGVHTNILQTLWMEWETLQKQNNKKIRCIAMKDLFWEPLPAIYSTQWIASLESKEPLPPQSFQSLLNLNSEWSQEVQPPVEWQSVGKINSQQDAKHWAKKSSESKTREKQ